MHAQKLCDYASSWYLNRICMLLQFAEQVSVLDGEAASEGCEASFLLRFQIVPELRKITYRWRQVLT